MIAPTVVNACLSMVCALPLTAACGDAPTAAPAPAKAPPAPTVLRARLEFDTGEARATGLLAADLDGDGRDELVALLRGPGAIRVGSGYSNRLGVELRAVERAVGDYALGPVRVGAWAKGADRAIVAVASRAEPSVELVDVRALFLGRGEPAVGRIELPARPRVLASGDLGLDGVPDLAVITIEDELLIVRDGAIVSREKLADRQATCARFTDDGRALLVGSQESRRVVRLEPAADGTWSEHGAAQLDGLPRSIDEIDGWRGKTGRNFVVAAGDDQVVWLDEKLAVERVERAAAVPIDVGHTGVAPKRTRWTVSVHGQSASVEREDAAEPVTLYAGQHPSAGALGDLDGDGRLDLALANGDAKRIGIAFSRAPGGFDLAERAKTGRSPHSIDVGDFDGDGKLDVVALCALDRTVQMHRGTDAGLADGVSQGPAESAHRVRARDLDGDGKLDVAFLRETDRGCVLDAWFGDGTGRLWARGETRPVACASSPGDLWIGDLERDGTLEAVVSDPNGSKISVVPITVTKSGSVEFGEPRAFDVAGAPRDIALFANVEGASAFAVALTGPVPRAGWCVLRATRTSIVEAFHQPCAERARGIDVTASAIAYLGGGEGSGVLSYFERDAQAYFERDAQAERDPAQLARSSTLRGPWPTGLRAYAVRCGDLDGDGRGDVVASSQNSHQINLWLGRAAESGATLERMPDVGVGTGPLDMLLADLDGDGALEIVVACAFSDEIAVVRLR